jgi:heme exporter protein C
MVRTVWKVLIVPTVAMLVFGAWLGLVWAPPEREMGEVYRILYAHVPLVQMALLAATINFVCSVVYLLRASWRTDALAEASAEVGLVFAVLGTTLGSIFGRPTWGVYWAWDPRLTSMAVFIVAYAGYLALRRFVDDPEKRAVWSAVAGIVIAVDVPIVYFSVRWWKSLHQVQSSPKTFDSSMTWSLRANIVGYFLLFLVFLAFRHAIALAARRRETTVPEAARPISSAVPS